MQAGLEPTHQVKKMAVTAGFDNVHDYLVHLVTGGTKGVGRCHKCEGLGPRGSQLNCDAHLSNDSVT